MNKVNTSNHGGRPGLPVFVGRTGPSDLLTSSFIYSYMTAEQMQARITALTGYEHPDFITFGDILGRNDPASGTRTNTEPSVLSILMLLKIATDIATMVVEREIFLGDQGRMVFAGIDLERAPEGEALSNFLSELYQRWLNTPLSRLSLRLYLDRFNSTLATSGPTAAYQSVLALLLEHGGLFYV